MNPTTQQIDTLYSHLQNFRSAPPTETVTHKWTAVCPSCSGELSIGLSKANGNTMLRCAGRKCSSLLITKRAHDLKHNNGVPKAVIPTLFDMGVQS